MFEMRWRLALLAPLAALAAMSAVAYGALAQAYPTRSIRWIVPYTPGGLTDSVTRLVAPKLQDALGQPIHIENRPGSNSITGSEIVASATPDGYTFGTVIAAHAANATLYGGRLPFDTEKSFAPVSVVGIAPLILTIANNFPAASVKELIDYARANPGRVVFGSSGVGSAAHLTSELMKQVAGVEMLHVPYKGTTPALQALLGGEIQVLVDVPSTLLPQVRVGKIKGLAMFAGKRLAAARDIPTVGESGGPPIESSTWVMFLAPARTPVEIVARISKQVGKIVTSAEMRQRLEAQGIDPVGGTPADAANYLAQEIAKWGKVISTANVKPE